MEGFNVLPIIAAVIADMAVGMLWYSPFLFGTYWQKETGMKDMDMKQGQKAMAFALLPSLGMALVLNVMLEALKVTTVDGAIETAFVLWLGFIATTNAAKVIYERGKFSIYALQVSYNLVALMLMAIIITLWK